jgi:hypothetical protein
VIFASQSREQLRATWLTAWRKHRARELLTPLESQLVGVIELHPEYYGWLEDGERASSSQAATDNPFLHLSLHLALREQLATDRPAGIKAAFDTLALRLGDRHDALHRAMEVLGRTLWEAQRSNRAPDEQAYLAAMRSL